MKSLHKYLFKYLFFLGCLFFICLPSSAQNQKTKDKKEFPKPTDIKNLLFYVQRTLNTNTLIYSLNINDKKEIIEKEPVKIYWINYAKDGGSESLSTLQRKYAYGVDIEMVDTLKKTYCFNFVSYKKQKIYLIKSATDNKYEAISVINNKLMVLSRIFIQIEGGTFWIPKIKYIEITGKDPVKGEEIITRIIP